MSEWVCKARTANVGANDPQDCDWPFCGCDETATKVVEVLFESGWMSPKTADEAATKIRDLRAALCALINIEDTPEEIAAMKAAVAVAPNPPDPMARAVSLAALEVLEGGDVPNEPIGIRRHVQLEEIANLARRIYSTAPNTQHEYVKMLALTIQQKCQG